MKSRLPRHVMALPTSLKSSLPLLRLPIRQPQCLQTTQRLLSTTTPVHGKQEVRLGHRMEGIPPYPHGASPWYKKSNYGLYGGLKVRFGNNVSHKTETKTRRAWHPNTMRKHLWSESLQRMVRVKVATRVLRTIDKVGGLDEYVLGDKGTRIKELGVEGWRLRWRIMQTDAVKARFAKQREELGIEEWERRAMEGSPLEGEGYPIQTEEGLTEEERVDAQRARDQEREEAIQRYDAELDGREQPLRLRKDKLNEHKKKVNKMARGQDLLPIGLSVTTPAANTAAIGV